MRLILVAALRVLSVRLSVPSGLLTHQTRKRKAAEEPKLM